MKRVFLLIVGLVVVLAFFGMGFYVSYQEMAVPLALPVDENTDSITQGVEVSDEVAIMDETTDLARVMSDNQAEQAKDATAKIATVATAGYGAIMGVEVMHTIRDVFIVGALALVAVMWLKGRSSKN